MDIRRCTLGFIVIALMAICADFVRGQSSSASQVESLPTSDFDRPEPQQYDIQFESDNTLPPDTSGHPSADLTEPNEQCTSACIAFNDSDPKCDGVSLSGSLDTGGVTLNGRHPNSRFNGPVTYNDRDEGQLNQLYMVGGSSVGSREDGWFGGTRMDLMFGNDYFFTTAAGLDGRRQGNLARWYVNDTFRYGWSMPQLFTEIGYGNVDVKLGHFYTPIGYEDAQADHNFFMTRSYAFQYGEPKTHTGILATQSLDDCWSWTSGVVGGWDTFNTDTRAALIGGLTYSANELGSVNFTMISGNDSTENSPGVGPFANRTMYSLVAVANLSSRMTYVFQHDLGVQQNATTLQGRDHAEWYGLNQYLYYKLHDCWSVGARFEWFRDDDGFNVTGLRPGNPLVGNFFAGNFYETSIGLNCRACSCMTLRPEVRYDWFKPDSTVGSQNPFDDNTSKNQILYGIDAILCY